MQGFPDRLALIELRQPTMGVPAPTHVAEMRYHRQQGKNKKKGRLFSAVLRMEDSATRFADFSFTQ